MAEEAGLQGRTTMVPVAATGVEEGVGVTGLEASRQELRAAVEEGEEEEDTLMAPRTSSPSCPRVGTEVRVRDDTDL